MNVLVVHNRYREPGGEDRVVELETSLLERHGHTVVPYILDNASIADGNPLALAARTIWNRAVHDELRAAILRARIDVVHVHNTLPLVSPAAYYAAAATRVPVIQTLHNYRMICPSAVLLRDGRPCVTCVGHAPLAAIRHACYRGSRTATAAVSAMLIVHRAAGTWQRRVDTYIAPTEFVRGMFVAGGLPSDRIVVKPHFVDPDPGVGWGHGRYALFVGRLSPEKGLDTLIAAWSRLQAPVPLRIVGDGPLAPLVADAAARIPGITWLGRRNRAEVQVLMADAALLILPSIFFETFGQVAIEAFAAGTPVLASSGGAAAELITPGRSGVLVRAGDPDALARKVDELFSSPTRLLGMRGAARLEYETRFTADANYQQLIAIYRRACERATQVAEHPSHRSHPAAPVHPSEAPT
jgi:glycosyltransferase involved in cell wall biosynthesis